MPTEIEESLFVQQIIDLKPKLVGISVLSPYFLVAKRLTKLIKENSSALVIWGGVHPTISPETCIDETDLICIGEGEGAITELVACLRDGTDYSHIENLWIKNGTDIVRNPMRPLIQDLDSLPFPSYGNDSFFFINSNKMNKNDPILTNEIIVIQSSRGCPYVCSYCVNSLLRPLFKNLGRYSRRRSVNSVIKEIKEIIYLSENPKSMVLFADEVFGNKKSWLDEFELHYKKEIGLPFYLEFTPAMIKPRILDKLIRSGLDTINFGIQSGSDYVRNQIFSRPGKKR